MKSWILWQSRRGMKELDLILEHFAQSVYEHLENQDKVLYHSFLNEQDGDLWNWFFNLSPVPQKYQSLVHKAQACYAEKSS